MPDAPPRAVVQLVAANGSTVSGTLSIVQGDDETALIGTLAGLTRSGSYVLSRRDHCAGAPVDDDARRSTAIVYAIAVKADARGGAAVSDHSQVIHLDGPMSLIGAAFAVSRTAGGKALACGRVTASE